MENGGSGSPFFFLRSTTSSQEVVDLRTNGICRVTGKLIDKAGLRAVPHATLSIEAKMGQAR